MGEIAFRIERSTRTSRVGTTLAASLVLVLALAPYWAGPAGLRLMIEIFCYLALASLWNLLAGYAGLVSIGQHAFVGLGGYMLFAFAIFLDVPPLLALPVAGVAVAVLAVPTAFVVFRLRGAYFAIGTWVVAEVFRLVFAQISMLGGGSGMSLPATIVREIAAGRAIRDSLVYWTALAIILTVIGLVYGLLRSSLGLALTAIRDSEPAAASLGVDNYRTKFLVYVTAAAATGMVGALIFLQKLWISPDAAFSVNDWTAFVIFIVVIGGIGTIEGPILGTLLFFVLRQLFADLGSWYLMMLGALAVVIMLGAPKGVWGYFAERFELHLFPVQRRVRLLE
jgi:branched-chain amino acid transport system permease protein